jgi:large repetitive protein
MRKITASLFAVVAAAILAGVGLGGTAFAASAPLVQECSAAANGGSLVNGVCDMPGAVVGGDYYSYINASNNDAADRFSIVSGSLPPGLTMPAYLGVADTVIEGDATQAGTYTFVVQAADPNGGLSSNQAYSITAADLACPADSNGGTATGGVCVLPAAAVGQQYAEPFAYASSTGGSFTVTGTLPPGLSASGTTVAGSPTQQGTFTFTVTESAQAGPPLQEAYSITVGPPLPLTETTAEPSAGTVGTAYTAGFTLSGGEAPYTWSQVSGQLPPGLALASSGAPGQTDNELTGTPTTAGTYVFTMQVTDTLGDTASGQVSITIDPRPPLKISEPTVAAGPAGTVGTAYPGIGFAATGGQTPYTWTVATGQVPPGLAFHTPSSYQRHTFPGADIILTGTPTTAGTFTFTTKVTDSLGDTATQSLSITIKA